MGLFSNKKKDGAQVVFYDGELQGFSANTPSRLHIENATLSINRINPDVQVALPLDRIVQAEVMPEPDYMRLHKGTVGIVGQIPRWVLRIAYSTQSGDQNTLAFWFTPQEHKKVTAFVEQLKISAPAAYTL